MTVAENFAGSGGVCCSIVVLISIIYILCACGYIGCGIEVSRIVLQGNLGGITDSEVVVVQGAGSETCGIKRETVACLFGCRKAYLIADRSQRDTMQLTRGIEDKGEEGCVYSGDADSRKQSHKYL